MLTIVVANQKGGVGKTTLAAHLAVMLELAGQGPVVLLDTDPQGSLASWWNKREAPQPAFGDATIASLPDKLKELAKGEFRWCIVDTPPAATGSNVSVIQQADLVLVPTKPSPLDLEAVGVTLDACKRAGRRFLFVVNAAKPQASITMQTLAALSEHGQVAPAMLVDRVLFASSMVDGRTVMELEPKGRSAAEIKALCEFVISSFNEKKKSVKKEKAHV